MLSMFNIKWGIYCIVYNVGQYQIEHILYNVLYYPISNGAYTVLYNVGQYQIEHTSKLCYVGLYQMEHT